MDEVQHDAVWHLYAIIRIVGLYLAVALLLSVLYRFRYWFSSPPTYNRLLGLLAGMVPLTVLGNALDQHIRDIEAGPASVGTLAILITLASAMAMMPTAKGKTAPLLAWGERLGIRVQSRKTRR